MPTLISRKANTLADILPGLLSIKSSGGSVGPMTLDDHFVFRPLFGREICPRLVVRASRQIGKTNQFAARLILQAAVHPGQSIIVVLPLQEQSDRTSSQIFRPFLEDSPVRALLGAERGLGSVRRREFDNRSVLHFLYAFLSAERSRGTSGQFLYIDESQDMDSDHLPILESCLDAAPEPVKWFSGTSKTNDTALEVEWQNSSQGVWHVPCHACGFENVCCLEPDGHLLAMIGPARDDISEERPGTLCHRCRTPVRPRLGYWRHRYPERRKFFQGYHIPQVAMPIHYANPVKWATLVSRMNGRYTTAKFYNECLGEAFDAGTKLITLEELRRAGAGVGPNTEAAAVARAKSYRCVCLGVDWGGGGEEGVSLTKLAACGLRGDGTAEVFYGAQFPPTTDRVAEAREVLRVAAFTRANLISIDYVGDGRTSESVLAHLGWPSKQLVPMAYRQNLGGNILSFQKATDNRTRPYYSLDKTESLRFLCLAVRAGKVRFFDYDYVDPERPGLIYDFMALIEERLETPTGGVYRIRRSATAGSDDFAHATNYGMSALWEYMQAWPDVTKAGVLAPRPGNQ